MADEIFPFSLVETAMRHHKLHIAQRRGKTRRLAGDVDMSPKNIAVFCDGTWQHIGQPVPTNVNRLARAVAPFDGNNVPQFVRYDDGVGVGTGILDKATELIGGAFGEGLETKVMQAYAAVCLNYVPGDRIFIFGFSRGAYTARSLAGLLALVWILRRDHLDKLDAAREIYHDPARKTPGPGNATARAYADWFKTEYCHSADPTRLSYVGVWDTVGELGIPTTLPFAPQIDGKFRFLDTKLSQTTASARHAVAIDERRDTYKPTLWDNIDLLNADAGDDTRPYGERRYQQQWFPGHHSGVGGGQADGGLCLDALLWIADGAQHAGLAFDPAQIGEYDKNRNASAPFVIEPPSAANFFVNHVGGESDRVGPTLIDQVSEAARKRWQRISTWRPPTLAAVASDLDGRPRPVSIIDVSDQDAGTSFHPTGA